MGWGGVGWGGVGLGWGGGKPAVLVCVFKGVSSCCPIDAVLALCFVLSCYALQIPSPFPTLRCGFRFAWITEPTLLLR